MEKIITEEQDLMDFDELFVIISNRIEELSTQRDQLKEVADDLLKVQKID